MVRRSLYHAAWARAPLPSQRSLAAGTEPSSPGPSPPGPAVGGRWLCSRSTVPGLQVAGRAGCALRGRSHGHQPAEGTGFDAAHVGSDPVVPRRAHALALPLSPESGGSAGHTRPVWRLLQARGGLGPPWRAHAEGGPCLPKQPSPHSQEPGVAASPLSLPSLACSWWPGHLQGAHLRCPWFLPSAGFHPALGGPWPTGSPEAVRRTPASSSERKWPLRLWRRLRALEGHVAGSGPLSLPHAWPAACWVWEALAPLSG